MPKTKPKIEIELPRVPTTEEVSHVPTTEAVDVDGEVSHESNNFHPNADPNIVQPEPGPEPWNPSQPEAGQFVGLGVESVACAAGEFTVDRATGLIL